MFFVLEEVFDLDGDVVGESRKFLVQSFNKRDCVPSAIEKIGIAERDVLRPGRHLLPNVFQYDFTIHDAENTVIDGHDGAVAA